MKKLIAAATITAAVFSLSACSSGDNSEAVVETEAGKVTKDQFYEAMKDRYGETVLRELVTIEVLDDKYDVSKEDVDKEVNKVKERLGDNFETVLKQQGYNSEDAFRNVIKLSLLQEEAVAEEIKISDKELKQKYERMKTEIQASHILVKDKKTAKEVEKKLKNGADFAKLAKEYSTDKGTAKKGGKLGYFSTGDMVPEFEDAAYNLKKGEVSDPVKSQFGYHIIKVTDKREKKEDIGSFKENKDDIRRDILNKRMDVNKAREKINNILQDADIDVKIDGLEDMFKQDKKKQNAKG
ncbi:peptidylprolyl isomerase [Virgibacillus siamensis]|uniref:peptidylprolyl isomerase n=1 Tax=Virgibacillus siamensis TaxID=480071 RepID=UPI000984333E|nr:peptidylprolyl isomerase [Virgibacillus siamensis]